jgi:predicted protein tyrosine phosphatase
MSEIIPDKLFLGDINYTYDTEFLKEYNIKHIITILESEHKTKAMIDLHISHVSIKLNDSMFEPIYDVFDFTTNYIHNALKKNESVLVHCFAGISRSPTIVIAYLIKYHNLKFEEAFDFVRKQRIQICPNEGFIEALIKYESTCKL